MPARHDAFSGTDTRMPRTKTKATESMLDDAALAWFTELDYAVA